MPINSVSKKNKRQSLSVLVSIAVIFIFVNVAYAQKNLYVKPEQNFLWSVETERNTVYLLGSIHVLSGNSYPLPKAIENVYDCCEKIVFETDLDGMNGPASQKKMMTLGLYPEGQRLIQNISARTYGLLKDKVGATGLQMVQFDRFKPWLAALTLTSIELQKLGFDPNSGVDRYFFNKAKKDKKEMIFLETNENQINLIAKMSRRNQELFLREALKELEVIGTMSSDMVKFWKSGDVDKLESIIKISFNEFPDIYNRFFVQRNKRWILKIEKLMKHYDDVLIIVGSGHFVGADSIVELLRKKGYKVKKR